MIVLRQLFKYWQKNLKPTILRFVNTTFLKIAIFHVYGSNFIFQNGRPDPNLKKILNIYFRAIYQYIGHKNIVT